MEIFLTNYMKIYPSVGGGHGSLVGGCHFSLVCRVAGGARQRDSAQLGRRLVHVASPRAHPPIRPRRRTHPGGRIRRVDRNRRRVHVHVHAHDVVSLCLCSATVKLPLLCFPLLGSGCCSVCAVGWTPPLAVARRCRAPRLPPPPPTSPSLHIRARARRAPATTSCRTAPPRPPQLLAFLVGGIEAGSGAARLDPGGRRRRSRSSAAAPEVRGVGSLPSDSAPSAASGSRLSLCFAQADAEQLHQHDLCGQ